MLQEMQEFAKSPVVTDIFNYVGAFGPYVIVIMAIVILLKTPFVLAKAALALYASLSWVIVKLWYLVSAIGFGVWEILKFAGRGVAGASIVVWRGAKAVGRGTKWLVTGGWLKKKKKPRLEISPSKAVVTDADGVSSTYFNPVWYEYLDNVGGVEVADSGYKFSKKWLELHHPEYEEYRCIGCCNKCASPAHYLGLLKELHEGKKRKEERKGFQRVPNYVDNRVASIENSLKKSYKDMALPGQRHDPQPKDKEENTPRVLPEGVFKGFVEETVNPKQENTPRGRPKIEVEIIPLNEQETQQMVREIEEFMYEFEKEVRRIFGEEF